tara:strand:+ start:2411 stop:2665 length:255 start_codon:yes stop_codon:yes gene_type:complete
LCGLNLLSDLLMLAFSHPCAGPQERLAIPSTHAIIPDEPGFFDEFRGENERDSIRKSLLHSTTLLRWHRQCRGAIDLDGMVGFQ